MRHFALITITMLALVACGGSQQTESTAVTSGNPTPGDAPDGADEAPSESSEAESAKKRPPIEGKEFEVRDAEGMADVHGAKPSKIKPTATEAAVKFVVVDKDKGPIEGVVISLTAPDGTKYYTEETDAEGYTEVLVPAGRKYELVYLSLGGKRDVAAKVEVKDEPNYTLRLTLRYKRERPPEPVAKGGAKDGPGIVLNEVQFDSGKATIRPESYPELDRVAEYMTHKKSVRVRISGHTDNVGKAKDNKALSKKRAEACRTYLISKGIDGSRIEAVGFGDERPIASNDTDAGRQKNRRIEATEL